MPTDIPDKVPPPQEESVSWGFAVLAVVFIIILVGWGWSGQGRGWGRDNAMAHFAPPADTGMSGPATRAWTPSR
jgi:hypothetical protein